MTSFTVDPEVFDLFPDARIGVIVVHGLSNEGESTPEVQRLLADALEVAPSLVPNPEFSQNDIIQTWRKAFQKFPGKKSARSSVEAMLKRAAQGKGVGSINPLVDVYNAVSLTFGVPVGGEDLAKVSGDIHLTRAAGGEDFVTYGSSESEPAVAGEVIYRDEAGAICRNWNWREAERTMLTETTTDAVMVIEAVDAERPDAFDAALERLAADITQHLGGTCRSAVLTKDEPTVALD